MTDVTPETTRGLNRRTLLRNGLVVGLGMAAATIAVPAFAGVAQASSADIQLGWGWCSKCQALFFLAPASQMDRSNGVCPAGGQHGEATSDIYYLEYGWDDPPSNVQTEWNYCNKCAGLFWLPQIEDSVCPAGGNHSNILNKSVDTYNYGLYYGGESGNYEDNWLYCNYCRSLFYCYDPAGNSYQSGKCPGNVVLGVDFPHLGKPSYNYDVLTSGEST
jgi:hypothetical protein